MNKYINEIKDISLSFFEDEPVEVFLFGSRARGDAMPGSDVDVGVRFQNSTHKRITLLKEMIDDLNIPYKVDLVDFSGQESSRLYKEAIKQRIIWKTFN